MANEEQVWALLRSRGFEMVDPGSLSFDEQIATFAEAETIVAPHGGALTNMVFATGATVIELFEPGYVNPCFYAMAERSGHRYWYLIGEGRRADMLIEPERLLATVEAAAGD